MESLYIYSVFKITFRTSSKQAHQLSLPFTARAAFSHGVVLKMKTYISHRLSKSPSGHQVNTQSKKGAGAFVRPALAPLGRSVWCSCVVNRS
jgi:hypothetical protein